MTEEDYAILHSLFTLGIEKSAKRREMVAALLDLEKRTFDRLKETETEKTVIEPELNGVEQDG